MRLPLLLAALTLSACTVTGAGIRATSAQAADYSDCTAAAREWQTMGIDPMKQIDMLHACIETNMIAQEMKDEADRSFARGAADLARSTRAWQQPYQPPPRAIYCTRSGNGFICQ